MCAEAEQLGVTGWVRNAPDGSVEAVVQGTESQVHALIEWARKGPSGSRVEKVEVTEAAGQFDDFSISY
jgi:acylphosphatase